MAGFKIAYCTYGQLTKSYEAEMAKKIRDKQTKRQKDWDCTYNKLWCKARETKRWVGELCEQLPHREDLPSSDTRVRPRCTRSQNNSLSRQSALVLANRKNRSGIQNLRGSADNWRVDINALIGRVYAREDGRERSGKPKAVHIRTQSGKSARNIKTVTVSTGVENWLLTKIWICAILLRKVRRLPPQGATI